MVFSQIRDEFIEEAFKAYVDEGIEGFKSFLRDVFKDLQVEATALDESEIVNLTEKAIEALE